MIHFRETSSLNVTKVTLSVIAIVFLATITTNVRSEMSKRVGDYQVFFSVIPSLMFQGHPNTHPQGSMHGGVSATPTYHLMLAIVDAKTGSRVTTAKVSVRLKFKSGVNYVKKLEPMLLNGVINYGQYFELGDRNSIHIEVTILNGKKPKQKVTFYWSTA